MSMSSSGVFAGSGFWVFYGCVLAVMLVFRCVPLFALKGRDLSPRVSEALGYIPAAAFAALVANDVLDPAAGLDPVPLVSGVLVVAVAYKTKSLIWCALAGMVAYAALSLVL